MKKRGLKNIFSNRAQISLFIIVAIILFAGIVGFFLLKGRSVETPVPAEFRPVYDYYLSCIDADTYNGARLLGQGAGYLENPSFSPGSAYMPFSSQLSFMGFGVPYWFYIAGNGVKKEQVPTKENMQVQLNNFLIRNVGRCDFSVLEEQGYSIILGDVNSAETKINSGSIDVKIKQDIIISRGNSSWLGSVHSKGVNSNLGGLYDLARKVYDFEKQEYFLEDYGIDTLRLYAPVDGVEISCSPKLWNSFNVRNDLMNALEANVPQTKIKGDYYVLKNDDNKYFVKDIGENIGSNVNFIYSRNWPMRMEVWPSENGVMKADPVGLQQGLGMLGFCYIPYHFVYDLGYSVMIQVYDDESEIFQFPLVVYIDKNKPRAAPNGSSAMPNAVQELCQHKLSNKTISTYNAGLQPIEADISFKCFDTQCDIGRTKMDNSAAVFSGGFPQCVNGFIIANAEGYQTKKYLVTTLEENNIQIVLDKKYKVALDLKNGAKTPEFAIVTFTKNNNTITVAYPEQKTVDLTEGQYEVKAYVYSSSNINLQGTTSQKCVGVPKAGFLGVFGFNEEKCLDVEIPDQTIEQAVSGGGKQMQYITESELQGARKIVISSEEFKTPTKPEDLQINYNLVETTGLGISLEK